MKKWIVKIVKWTLLAIFLYTGYSALSIWIYSEIETNEKTDAAIVLGAAAWGIEPSPVLRERINQAIRLYEEGYVDKIIFTGGKISEEDFTESEVSRLYAIKQGVKEEDILIETLSHTTEENLENAYELVVEHQFERVTIVTDPLHMRRAMAMAKQIGLEAVASPTETSAYQTLKTKLPFFFRELVYYMGYELSIPFRKFID